MPTTSVYRSFKPPFETVVRDHGTTVFRVCCAIVGAHDADDAWSETFLAALKAYPDLPVDANVEAWLVTIAHHKAIDITRSRTRQPIPTDVVPEPARPGDVRDLDDLAAAVDRLPPKQKHAVAYHYRGPALQRDRRDSRRHRRGRTPRRQATASPRPAHLPRRTRRGRRAAAAPKESYRATPKPSPAT